MKYIPPEGFIPAAGQRICQQYRAMTQVAEAMGLATGGPQPKRGHGLCKPASANAHRESSTKRQRTLAAAQQLPQERAPVPAAPGCPSQQRSRPQQSTNPVQQQGSEAQQAPAYPAGSMAGTTDSMMAQKLVEFLQLNETKNKENEAALQRVAALQAENQQSACHIRQQQQELHAKDNELQRVAELEGSRTADLQRCMRQLAAAKAEAKELSAKLIKSEGSSDDNAVLAAACKEALNSSNAKVDRLAAELAAAQMC